MKSHLAVLVLISIFTVSVLGFVGLNFVHSHMKGNCVANVAAGVTCPVEDGIFAFAIFHIKALGGLGQAAFFSIFPLFLLAVIFLAIVSSVTVSDFSRLVFSRRYFRKNYEDKICDVGPKVFFWLARLLNSPSLAKGA
ncbi:MAG: hypothetical protein ABSE68_01140 [Minisyncoccia bacterium]